MTAKKTTDEMVPVYDGVSIVTSERYQEYANMLDTVLEPDVMYSHDDIDKILKKELKRKVVVEINE